MSALRRPQLQLAPSPRSLHAQTHLEDHELAEALIAGEPWAATATYHKHAPMVFRFLHRALGSRGEAEDLMQEVFVHVLSKVRGLRNRYALKSFILSVTIRTLKWELRRRRVRRLFHLSGLEDFPEPAAAALDAESRQAVRRLYAILDRLSAQERAAFVLRHIEHMKLDEIGQVLSVSLATVKRRLSRATRLVSREMDRDPSLAPYSKRFEDKITGGPHEAS